MIRAASCTTSTVLDGFSLKLVNPLHKHFLLCIGTLLTCVVWVCRIVDDIELYEQGRPLSTDTLATLASFLNSFYFSSIWKGLVGSYIITNLLLLYCDLPNFCKDAD